VEIKRGRIVRTQYSDVILAMKEVGGKRVHLQEIYDAVGHHRSLSDHDLEPHPTHGQQNYRHTVRSCLNTLQKYRLVDHSGKPIYSLTPLALEKLHIFEADSSGMSGGKQEVNLEELLAGLKRSRLDSMGAE
jgi:hypothetical protein